MPSNGALPLPRGTIFEGAAVLAIRPHNVRVAHQANQHTETARVADIENLGAEHVLHLDYGEQQLAVVTSPGYASVGDILHLAFDLIHAHLIDPASGEVVASGLRGAPL
jgi:ABC-type sugar transport system ATPase subunit